MRDGQLRGLAPRRGRRRALRGASGAAATASSDFEEIRDARRGHHRRASARRSTASSTSVCSTMRLPADLEPRPRPAARRRGARPGPTTALRALAARPRRSTSPSRSAASTSWTVLVRRDARSSRAASCPKGRSCFINISPADARARRARTSDWLRDAVEPRPGLPPTRVVVEVTERFGAPHRVGHQEPAAAARARLPARARRRRHRQRGARDAAEDRRRVREDRPQHRRRRPPTEPNARAVLMAMATFARQTGAFVIAEGIEDRETLDFLRGVKPLDHEPVAIIQGGQGFELGRPSDVFPVSDRAALNRRARAEARRPLRRSAPFRSRDRSVAARSADRS